MNANSALEHLPVLLEFVIMSVIKSAYVKIPLGLLLTHRLEMYGVPLGVPLEQGIPGASATLIFPTVALMRMKWVATLRTFFPQHKTLIIILINSAHRNPNNQNNTSGGNTNTSQRSSGMNHRVQHSNINNSAGPSGLNNTSLPVSTPIDTPSNTQFDNFTEGVGLNDENNDDANDWELAEEDAIPNPDSEAPTNKFLEKLRDILRNYDNNRWDKFETFVDEIVEYAQDVVELKK